MDYKTIGYCAGAVVGGFFLIRILERAGKGGDAPSSPSSPEKPAIPPSGGEQPIRILPGPLVMFPGHTYFAVLETNGTVRAAANPDRVKAEAEKQGFRDVAVFTDRPQFFPGTVRGDYYVRGTYMGAQQKTLPQKTNVFLGSVVVLDAYIAPL